MIPRQNSDPPNTLFGPTPFPYSVLVFTSWVHLISRLHPCNLHPYTFISQVHTIFHLARPTQVLSGLQPTTSQPSYSWSPCLILQLSIRIPIRIPNPYPNPSKFVSQSISQSVSQSISVSLPLCHPHPWVGSPHQGEATKPHSYPYFLIPVSGPVLKGVTSSNGNCYLNRFPSKSETSFT